MHDGDAHARTRAAIDAVWRIEAPRLIGALVRLTRDLDLAEDLAQEALLVALQRWPDSGIPDNPGAWLMTTARHRAVDAGRRRAMVDGRHRELAHTTPRWTAPDFDMLDRPVADDVLRLMLTACHPVLSVDARVALTLRLVAGLTTPEIARAFLTAEATMAQRLVRAKRTLGEARVPFDLPVGPDLGARIPPVLEAVYLIFNEGYAATTGDGVLRPALTDEAMRLGRLLVGLVPGEAEVHGLLALMELQASRTPARVAADGTPVLLLEQDRGRWDRLLITRGLAGLARAESLAQPLGPYALQAAIAACHARAATAAATDWPRIVAIYDALVEVTGSPIVALNRAMALGMAEGAAAGLEAVEALGDEPALAAYHRLPAAQGEWLLQLGRGREARAAFARAAALASNTQERRQLLARMAACGDADASSAH